MDAQLLRAFARQDEVYEPGQWDAAEEEYMRWLEEGSPSVDGLAVEDAHVLAQRPLTVALAAKRERVDPRTIYRWIKSGELVSHKAGSEHRIMADDLDRRRVESRKPKVKPEPQKRRRRRKAAATGSESMDWWTA